MVKAAIALMDTALVDSSVGFSLLITFLDSNS